MAGTKGHGGWLWLRRRALRLTAASGVLAVLTTLAFTWLPAWAANPVVTENQNAGSTGWYKVFDTPAQNGQIEGYLSSVTAKSGDVVNVNVSTSPAANYRVEVYRMGYYGGAGARLMTCLPSCSSTLAGVARSVPAPNAATGELALSWPVSTSFTVGSDWLSGYYIAVMVVVGGTSNGRNSVYPFVVTPPASRPKVGLVHAGVTTWEAYNNWPGPSRAGKSVYDYNSQGGVRGSKVSFLRPFNVVGNQNVFEWEVPTAQWLEKEGYDVAYTTDIDTHRNPGSLLGYSGVIVNGHDEYWSIPIRNAFDAARDSGVNLMFAGANDGYWHTRFENSENTMVVYKDAATDPVTDPAQKTVKFRDLVPSRPECSLIGVQFMDGFPSGSDRVYTVNSAALSDPWFAGTGFTSGATVSSVVGYEYDSVVTGCRSGLTTFFSYPGSAGESLPAGASTRYVAPSGAKVYSTGATSWMLVATGAGGKTKDARVEAFTRKAVTDILTPSTANTPPTVSVTAPVAGSTVTVGTPVSVSATAADAGGSVASVEFFAGATSLGVDATSPYSVSWTPAAAGAVSLTARATDNQGATTTSAVVAVTVVAGSNTPPTVSVTAPVAGSTVTVGTPVSVSATAADTDGSVASVEFFAGATSLGVDATSPYSVSWTPAAAGAVSLTAKATDNLGAATTSAVVAVTASGGSGSGAVTLVGSAQGGDNASSSQLQITLPAGIQAGDQIVVGVTTNQGVSLPTPAGYTLVTDYVPTSAWHPRMAVYRHTATGAETTFTLATGWEGKAGVALVYRGVDATTPVAAFSTASADGATVTAPSITAPSAGSMLVMFAGATSHSTPAGFTAPSGMTERAEVNTLPWYAATADDQSVGAGATGTRAATFGGAGAALGSVLLALKPA